MAAKSISQPLKIRLLLFLLFIILGILDLGLIQEPECRSLTVYPHNITASFVFYISERNITYIDYPRKITYGHKEIGYANIWPGHCNVYRHFCIKLFWSL